MRTALLAAASAACLALAALSTAAAAAPAGLSTLPGIGRALLTEKVDYRHYCRNWRHECGRRWGWGTWRFRRCLSIHGCL